MPAKSLSVKNLLAELDSPSVQKERLDSTFPHARALFKEELVKCRVNRRLFDRIKKALEITTEAGFILNFFNRLKSKKHVALSENPAKRQLALKRYLAKIEVVRPIVEKLSSKARKHGLTARLALHPLYLSSFHYFPTLVFSDPAGEVFWARFEATGKSLTVNHIQGLKCRKGAGEVDNQKLARVRKALEGMGYKRLRDGLFRDLCRASTGRFEKVHYLNPSKDPSFQIEPDLFYALARRQKMKRTKTKITKELPKPRRRKG